MVWIAGCWNSSIILLTSRNPKNNCWFSHIFGARFGGKDWGLCLYKPWSEQAGGWIQGFDDQKLKKKIQMKKCFDKKLQFTDVQATGEAYSPQKRTSSTSKKEIYELFSMFMGQFCPSRSRLGLRIRIRIQGPHWIQIHDTDLYKGYNLTWAFPASCTRRGSPPSAGCRACRPGRAAPALPDPSAA